MLVSWVYYWEARRVAQTEVQMVALWADQWANWMETQPVAMWASMSVGKKVAEKVDS